MIRRVYASLAMLDARFLGMDAFDTASSVGALAALEELVTQVQILHVRTFPKPFAWPRRFRELAQSLFRGCLT